MDGAFILGNIAAIITSFSFVPQVYKVVTTKDTKSISLPMYVLFVFGIALWLIYGLIKQDIPIIIANAVTLVLACVILFYKIKETITT